MDQSEFMNIALEEASKALIHDDVPIGALIVKDGKIISAAHNMRYFLKDATMHAEILAIKEACSFFNTQFLDGCDIYVTLEPCLMCSGAIIQARIKNLYYGAYDKKAGCAGSVLNVFTTPFNHKVSVEGGIMEDECSSVLSKFFALKREAKK
jgi:tRNA(adenine34) deaminase